MKTLDTMIKLSISTILIILFFACEKQQGYKINGNVAKFKGGKLFLKKKQNGILIVIDSAKVISGKFLFKGNVELPEMFTIVTDEGKSFPPIFVENSDIFIHSDADSLDLARITGSQSHDLFRTYKSHLDSIFSEYVGLNEHISAAYSQNLKEKAHVLEKHKDSLMNDYVKYTLDFVVEHKNSVVGAYILQWQRADDMSVSKLDSMISIFDTSLNKSVYIKGLTDKLNTKKKLEIGGIPPDFTINDQFGKPITMSSFRGKYLLIDFWASWCAPCRKETPIVLQSYKKFHSKGFEVLSVSLDEKKENWLNAIKMDKMEWKHGCDFKARDGEVAKLYFIGPVPTSFLVDKEGRIIAKNLRGNALPDKLGEIFNNTLGGK